MADKVLKSKLKEAGRLGATEPYEVLLEGDAGGSGKTATQGANQTGNTGSVFPEIFTQNSLAGALAGITGPSKNATIGGTSAGTSGNGQKTYTYYGGDTENPYTAQVQALYNKLQDRGGFNYDMQGDLLYRNYADRYSQLGQQAMRDTMGTAAGLTGGYGNSYASTVGNQAYQQYMNQLNAMVPELYDRAYQRWQQETNDLMQQYEAEQQMASSWSPGYYVEERGEEEDGDNLLWQGLYEMLTSRENQNAAAENQQLGYNYYNEWLKHLQNQ